MKKLCFLASTLLLAATCLAHTRDWKVAKIEVASDTDVSSKLLGEKNTMHYTVETEDMIYFADYSFNPAHHNAQPPNISVNSLTKIAIEGHHAYVLDVTGKEVKLHISRKTKK